MGPEACPNVTINPSGRRQSSERRNVSLPTQSKTTGSFSPPEIRETSATKSCFVFRIEDRVVAAVGMGHFGLSFRRNGADDRCAEGGRPLTENEARSAGRRLTQAHLTRPGLTDIDSCPVQNLGTARLPNLDRMRHTDFRKNMNSAIF